MERAELGVDGNCGFALLGEDLAVGEAEFVEIARPKKCKNPVDAANSRLDPSNYDWNREARRAAAAAYNALKARLPDREFSYYIGPSYPGRC